MCKGRDGGRYFVRSDGDRVRLVARLWALAPALRHASSRGTGVLNHGAVKSPSFNSYTEASAGHAIVLSNPPPGKSLPFLNVI